MKVLNNVARDVFMRGFGVYSLQNIKDNVIDAAIKGVKIRYGEELVLYDNDINNSMGWIKKYDKKYDSRPKSINGILSYCSFVMKLDENTFAYVNLGDRFKFKNPGRDDRDSYCLTIYIFGKKYKTYIEELKKFVFNHDESNLYIYDVKGTENERNGSSVGINSVGRIMSKRDIDTLFFNDDIKERICSHIENFFKNKEIYEAKNLTYKTGILLYGAPGTGKSSLSIALATKYKYNVIVIDMTTFDKLDVTTLSTTINIDTDKYIILLEDIDTLFDTLDREDNVDKDDRKIINKMLQFLDSSSSPNDVIFIATTNHIEKLDSAITRAGRFDLKVEIGNIDHETARNMVNSFNVEPDDVEKIISKCNVKDDGRINPAELQNEILGFFKEKLIIEDNGGEENE